MTRPDESMPDVSQTQNGRNEDQGLFPSEPLRSVKHAITSQNESNIHLPNGAPIVHTPQATPPIMKQTNPDGHHKANEPQQMEEDEPLLEEFLLQGNQEATYQEVCREWMHQLQRNVMVVGNALKEMETVLDYVKYVKPPDYPV